MATNETRVAPVVYATSEERHFRGVRKRGDKYGAIIRDPKENYRAIWLGSFDTGEEAARVYDAKAVELYRRRAKTNFPQVWSSSHTTETHYRGVKRTGGPSYMAVIHSRKKGYAIKLGTFSTPEEAARAYDAKALEFQGDRAKTNFPRENYINTIPNPTTTEKGTSSVDGVGAGGVNADGVAAADNNTNISNPTTEKNSSSADGVGVNADGVPAGDNTTTMVGNGDHEQVRESDIAGVTTTSEERHYRGVKKVGQKYGAMIRDPTQDYCKLWLGTFPTAEEAALAYDAKAFEFRGIRARTNFPHLWKLDPTNEPRYRGVRKRGPSYTAMIYCAKKRYQTSIGTFPTPEEAARAYDARALEIQGDRAKINFPRENYINTIPTPTTEKNSSSTVDSVGVGVNADGVGKGDSADHTNISTLTAEYSSSVDGGVAVADEVEVEMEESGTMVSNGDHELVYEGSKSPMARMGLDFDLNLPPPSELEEF